VTTYEATVTVTCNAGYAGGGAIECKADGQWTAAPKCDRSQQCGNFQEVVNGQCTCKPGYYDTSNGRVVCFEHGFSGEAVSATKDVLTCQRCGDAAQRTWCFRCPDRGKVTLEAGYALSGESLEPVAGAESFTEQNKTTARRLYFAFACASNTTCPASSVARESQVGAEGKLLLRARAGSGCPAGSRGPLCGVCSEGYTGGANRPCVECKKAKGGAASLVALLMLCALLGGVALSMRSTKAERAALGTAKKLKDVQSMLRIAVGNYQVISMMPTVFKIDYPSGFETVVNVLRVLSLDILKVFSLDCTFDLTYFDKYLLMMLTPFALILLICAIGKVNGQSLDEMLGSISLVLFLLYPSISAKTFELFECRDLGDGTRLHKLDYALDCESDTYAGYEAFASLMIAMYPVGIPAIFALMTFRRKVKLDVEVNEDATEYRHGSGAWHAVDGDEDKLSDVLEVQHQMDFLCGSYERRFFWWELVEYGRKFLLTGALIFVEQESVSQTFIGMSISFFFFALVSNRQPYMEQAADNLKMFSETQLFFTLLCSLMLQTDLSEQLVSRDVVDAVLVAVNAIAMPFVLVLAIVAAIAKKERKSGDKTLRENLAAGRARAGTEVEMGESSNPLADVADEE